MKCLLNIYNGAFLAKASNRLEPFTIFLQKTLLRQKWVITELFVVRISLYSDWIWRDTPYISVSSPNAEKCEPQITPYLDTFAFIIDLCQDSIRPCISSTSFSNISNCRKWGDTILG